MPDPTHHSIMRWQPCCIVNFNVTRSETRRNALPSFLSHAMTDKDLDNWRPETAEAHDVLTSAPLRRLAALFDVDRLPWSADELPPLGHWLFFLPEDKQSTLSRDGHPPTGGMLPPVTASRRMWAGGALEFLEPVLLGGAAIKRSTVEKVEHKQGKAGPLTFVTVQHGLFVDGRECVRERQDIVYLSDAPVRTQGRPSERAASAVRQVSLDITALFRFSALTFNAHRIHYDDAYAREVEGYPGLLVHGPLQAMLLLDHVLQTYPGARPKAFSFRAVRPLVCHRPFELRLAEIDGVIETWTADCDGVECMQARAVLS